MSIYIKAKHWQVFIVLVGTMFLFQLLMFSAVMNGRAPNFQALTVLTLFMAILFFGWLWSISIACYKALPPNLATSPMPMKICLIYALIYLAVSGTLFFGQGRPLHGYVFVMHLLAMAAIFYSLGFTAKQLTKLEQRKEVAFPSYVGSFVNLWFFPIGVWFIQPKVNRLLGQKNE